MLRTAAVFALLMAAIVPLLLLLDRPATSLSDAQRVAVESRLDEFCGWRNWQNPRWFAPASDDKGRVRVRVQFDYNESRVDATVVLIGDRVHALILHPDGDTSAVSHWLELSGE